MEEVENVIRDYSELMSLLEQEMQQAHSCYRGEILDEYTRLLDEELALLSKSMHQLYAGE